MKTFRPFFAVSLLAAWAAVWPFSGQAVTIAFDNPVPSTANPQPAGGPLVLGLDFTVVRPTRVLSLGAYDNAQDGVFVQPVQVAILEVVTGQEVTPVVEFSTDDPGALVGGSRFKPIPPVTLSPGRYSVVAAVYWGYGYGLGEPVLAEPFVNIFWGYTSGIPSFNDGSGNPSAGPITYRFDFGSSLTLPSQAIASYPYPDYAAGTFMFDGLLAATGSGPHPNPPIPVPDGGGGVPGSLLLTPALMLLRRRG